MKRSLIFLLAAGPLFVSGQRLDQPPTFKSFHYPAPWPGPGPGLVRSGDTAFFRRSLAGAPVRVLSGLPVQSGLRRLPVVSGLPVLSVQIPFAAGFTVQEMPPDRMPCLVPLRTAERMPMSMRGNGDPLPNAFDKPTVGCSKSR